MGKKITVVEVCPRDGWQNHKVPIPTETKVKYIKEMIDYGATMFYHRLLLIKGCICCP